MKIDQIKQWISDAVADGWSIEPSFKNESIETACSLKKDNFQALASMRKETDCGIGVWTLDDIGVNISFPYSYEEIKKATRDCHICGATDVETTRMAFADRCCLKCRRDPKVIAKYEYRGWCD